MKRNLSLFIAVCLVAGLFAACSKEDSAPKNRYEDILSARQDSLILQYLATNNLTAYFDPSGLYFRILNPGDGVHYITLTDTPYVIYSRRLLNGMIVESSKGQVTNFDGRQLKDHIPGWQIGLQKISKGGTIELYIPAVLGFGSQAIYEGNTLIVPANAVQICQVELVDFH
ncbi:MAG TPA: FKBP-type peptidyl-prolyl cis-trans isomerase [Chitinophaga sp.]